MATGQYPRRASGAFTVNCQDMLWKIILQRTVNGSRRRGRLRRKSWKDQHRGMDNPLDVVIAADRG